MAALLVTTDLMATSASHGAAEAAGVELRVASPGQAVEAVEEATRLVAIDLASPIGDLPTLVEGLRTAAPEATLLAYGPHVHEAKLAAAREAGCDPVLSRGQFHKGMAELLRRYAG